MTTLTFQQDSATSEPEPCTPVKETITCSCESCDKRAERLAMRCSVGIVLASFLYAYGMLDGAPEGLLSEFERFACQALIPGMLAAIAAIGVYALWKSRRRSKQVCQKG